jgi:hypothetical protein
MTPRRALAPVLVLLALFSGWPLRGEAFSLLPAPPGNRLVMRLHLDDTPFQTHGFGVQSWQSLAVAALSRWNAVGVGVGRDREFFSVGDPVITGDPCNRDDGINEVRFTERLCGLGWGDVIGVTRTRIVGGKTIQTDVLFNPGNAHMKMDAYLGPLQLAPDGRVLVDFFRLALHEFGHAAGLNHPDDAGQTVEAVMNSVIGAADDLQADDIAGVRAVAWGEPLIERYIRGFYTTVLGRVPTPAEVRAWVRVLTASPERATTIVRGFFHSHEFLTMRRGTLADYVAALYGTILMRAPAPEEVQAWVPLVLERVNRLIPGFLDSAEFQQVVRTTPPAIVITRLYEQVLGRRPSPLEIGAWLAELEQTGDWYRLSRGFLNSPEYLTGSRSFGDHVATLYRTFLGRSPSDAELAAWLGVLTTHLREIEDVFIASPEFQDQLQLLF